MSERVDIVFGNPKSPTAFKPNWTRLYGRKSFDELCSSLEFDCSVADRKQIAAHKYFGFYYSLELPGYSLKLRPVMTGYVDTIQPEANGNKQLITIKGRSAARDIIDSTWSDSLSNKKLFEIVQYLTQKFGITDSQSNGAYYFNARGVGSSPADDPTSVVTEFAWENESPWQKLQQEAANQGFVIYSSQIGTLYLGKINQAKNRWGFDLREGLNITKIKERVSGSEQFNTYIMRGGDGDEVTGTDPTCPNKRILTINLPDENVTKQQLMTRLQTEIRRRRQQPVTVTVSRWGLDPETVKQKGQAIGVEVFWELNFLTPVKIPTLGIDANLLTSQVEYRADSKSMSCDIQLTKPEDWV